MSLAKPLLTIPKSTGDTGAVVSLAHDDRLVSKGFCKTYGQAMPQLGQDGFAEFKRTLCTEEVEFGCRQTIDIPHAADALQGLVAHIGLDDRYAWSKVTAERVVESFELLCNGQIIYACSGPINAAICSARGKWPRQQHGDALVIPLLIPPMWHDSALIPIPPFSRLSVSIVFAPLQALVDLPSGYPHCQFGFTLNAYYVMLSPELGSWPDRSPSKTPIVIALDSVVVERLPNLALWKEAALHWFAAVDHAAEREEAHRRRFLDTGDMACGRSLQKDPAVAMLWTRFALPETVMVSPTDALPDALPVVMETAPCFEQFIPQLQCFEHVLNDDQVQRVPLRLHRMCTGLILVFAGEGHPFVWARVLVGNIEVATVTAVEAHDWEWIRCGASAPKPRDKRYFVALSKHAQSFDAAGFPCGLNASQLEVCLELHFDHSAYPSDHVYIGAIGQNTLISSGGMIAVRYSK